MMERRLRTCRCGHNKTHDLVVEEPEYTLWGWFSICVLGITPRPDHIVYRCQICRESVGTTRDPRLLKRRTKAQAHIESGRKDSPPDPPPELKGGA